MIDLNEDERGPQVTAPLTSPPITDALRAQARANPGAWVYAVDPEFDGSERVPPEGIVGDWRSDDRGAGVRIAVNPGSEVSVLIDPADITRA